MKKNDSKEAIIKMRVKATNLYVEAERRLMELRKIQSEKEQAIKRMPPGKIHVTKSKKRVQYYLRMDASDKSGTYLSQTEKKTIEKYVQKSYDEKILKAVSKEIVNLEVFLSKSKEPVNQIQQIYSSNPEQVKQYINPIDCSNEDFIEQWVNIPYERKRMMNEVPQYCTEKGELVRSKSELNIANALYRNRIPYKYECPLKLKDGSVIYPDFTVLDALRRKVLYWEHRGMMDDREYAKHAVMRIRDYEKNNIRLGSNLIITEETSTCALGTKEIEKVIKNYIVNP